MYFPLVACALDVTAKTSPCLSRHLSPSSLSFHPPVKAWPPLRAALAPEVTPSVPVTTSELPYFRVLHSRRGLWGMSSPGVWGRFGMEFSPPGRTI